MIYQHVKVLNTKKSHTYKSLSGDKYYSAINKEGNPAICDNMDGPWEYYAKWNQT